MSSFDRVIELVNEKNTTTYELNPNSVTLNNVIAESASTHNTRTTMKARSGTGGGYTGQVDLFYTRSNLRALGELAFWQEQPYTFDDLFRNLNLSKKATVGVDDFTNDSLPVMENGIPTTFLLSAKTTSLGWLGNNQVTLLTGIPAEAPGLDDFWNSEVGPMFNPR